MMAQPGCEQDTFLHLLEQHRKNIVFGDILDGMRQKGWQRFLEIGLPSRQNEVYRHIKLRHLFANPYLLFEEKSISHDQVTPWIYPECHHSVVVFVNGYYNIGLSRTQNIPPEIDIIPLTSALQTYRTFFNNQWNKNLKEEIDPFAMLNAALHGRGAFVYVPPKCIVPIPIQILNFTTDSAEAYMSMPRLQLFIGSSAHVQIVQSQQHLSHAPYFINQATELMLEEGAHVHYTHTSCNEHPLSWHFDALRATLKRDSFLKTVHISHGSMSVRTDYRIALVGPNAEISLNGLSMLDDKRESHVNVFVDHQAPYCRSHQLFKNVLKGISRSSFEGKIMVRQAGDKTEAFQLNNNLILSDNAHAASKPNLEIFSPDVKASHGATIGQIDSEQNFYMQTRGLSKTQATALQIYGFCDEVVENLTSCASLKSNILEYVSNYAMRNK